MRNWRQSTQLIKFWIFQSTIFAKKVFLIKNEVKNYSNRLHWFSSSRIFTDIDPFQEKVAFACKICKVTIQCRFPHFTNLSHHLALDDHGQFRKWKSLQPKIGGTAISDEVFALIKFLVSSYSFLRNKKTISTWNIETRDSGKNQLF